MMRSAKKFAWSLLVLFPLIVQAAPSDILPDNANPGGKLPTTIVGAQRQTIGGTFFAILNLFLGVVGIIAVGMVVYGGFRYITARGDEKALGEAKKTITNALIGLVIIILSFVIVKVITNAAFGAVA